MILAPAVSQYHTSSAVVRCESKDCAFGHMVDLPISGHPTYPRTCRVCRYRNTYLLLNTYPLFISISLLVVYRESVNLIGHITVDFQLIVYGKIVARVIVYVTLFQT